MMEPCQAPGWIGYDSATDNIILSYLNSIFWKLPRRSGVAYVPRHHLCVSVDICVYLCSCLLRRICRTGRDVHVSGKSIEKHRYTQISTDKHGRRRGRIAWSGARHCMDIDAGIVALARGLA
jgi:hypothetical protein